ncbi:helix-turn-helix domain-containing protein, partial [Streptomyces anulatus]|uniref:TetR/AcrR family transcriptional regulator n=1 Tax=Streptomyces anulatus TaxID=1892 RepID=UPI0033EF1445
MGRWEPDARERLVRAALDLFSEQGYENTAVAQIAERAGLTKSTFFRHFRDKREVLFGGQDVLAELMTGAISGAPEEAGPLEAVEAALEATARGGRRALPAHPV